MLTYAHAQEEEIVKLKERVKVLEDKEDVVVTQSGDDALIKGRSINEGDAAAERITNDSEEIARVLTSMDAATVLAGEIDVPTGSGFIPTAGPPATAQEEEIVKLKERVKVLEDKEDVVVTQSGDDALIKGRKSTEKTNDQEAEEGILYGCDQKQLGVEGKRFQREDLNQLWALVKEYLSIRPATSEKEMELWVELKRMYEPDPEDQLWTLTHNFMHAPVEWKLYDLSGVYHLTAKDREIFVLIEKDYPLRKGLALVMISYKLQVENYS
nr:hypothetical protein [Tanacetum cinerariifolium]